MSISSLLLEEKKAMLYVQEAKKKAQEIIQSARAEAEKILKESINEEKIRELNRAFFTNMTEEEEEKVWEEIRSKLESSDEIELLEYLKYAFPSLPLGDTTGLFWLITVIQPTTPFSSSTSRSFPAFPTT